MKRPTLLIVLLLSVLFVSKLGANPSQPKHSLATVSLIALDRNRILTFQSVSGQGFVIVAIQDSSLFIDGISSNLKAGGYKRVLGKQVLKLSSSNSAPTVLVLIEVLSASQPLTIKAATLAGHEQLEDASDRNDTLLVAINSIQLSDVQDIADEDKSWKSSSRRTIALRKGQTCWIKPGMHRLTNSRVKSALFVTIEW